MDERRKFLRVLFNRPAYLNHADQSWSCELLDLSLQGALVTVPNDWDKEVTKLTLSFNLTELAEDAIGITMDAEVRHTTEEHIGLHITHLDLDSASHLKRLIELNLGDDEALHRQLEQLIF
ncbi:PilZ domain-containing protein [Aliagarivorans marinus]|uniref:PilZ domain-containing protein n=1 Tax=Aliagarivorans marinus TaxID=561965 RepID=UPI0004790D2C|nr:PilZ domain-containing protein [Aliagarivorans marinus]